VAKVDCCSINNNIRASTGDISDEKNNTSIKKEINNIEYNNTKYNNTEYSEYYIELLRSIKEENKIKLELTHRKQSIFANPKVQNASLALIGSLFSLAGAAMGSFAFVDIGISFVAGAIIKSGLEKYHIIH